MEDTFCGTQPLFADLGFWIRVRYSCSKFPLPNLVNSVPSNHMIFDQEQDNTEKTGKHQLRIWIETLGFRTWGLFVAPLTFAFTNKQTKPHPWGQKSHNPNTRWMRKYPDFNGNCSLNGCRVSPWLYNTMFLLHVNKGVYEVVYLIIKLIIDS